MFNEPPPYRASHASGRRERAASVTVGELVDELMIDRSAIRPEAPKGRAKRVLHLIKNRLGYRRVFFGPGCSGGIGLDGVKFATLLAADIAKYRDAISSWPVFMVSELIAKSKSAE